MAFDAYNLSVSLPPYLQVQGGVVQLRAKVQPRASSNAIGETLGDELKIKIAAPPVDSAANEALVRFLADALGCSRSAVQLVRGHTSRHKVFALHGMTAGHVAARLAAAAST